MNRGRNDLLIEAHKRLGESATTLEVLAVVVSLAGVLLLGVFV